MTSAAPTTEPADRDLVERVRAGDRDAFAAVYDRYGPRLFDFAHSLTRNREDAADAVADSFVRFAERLGQLRDPDRLRPWLYAITRHECLRILKGRSRQAFDSEERLGEMVDDDASPADLAERAALRDLVWAAAAGLADRDRAMLDLHLRQGLDGAELGEAMGMSAAHAYTQLSRLRSQFERSLGALLVARTGREDCPELDRMLAGWDGTLTPLIRKRVARHLEGCETCGARRSRIVSPWALLAAVPIALAPAALRDRVLEQAWPIAAAGSGTGGGPSGGGSASGGTALKVAAVVAVGAGILAIVAWGISAVVALPPAPAPAASPVPQVDPLAAGELAVLADTLDLGLDGTAGTVALRNDGERPLRVELEPTAEWISVDSAALSIPPGDTVEVSVAVDRSGLPPGPSIAALRLVTKGATFEVAVRVEQPRPATPPRVGTPAVVRIDCSGAPRTVTVRLPVTAEASLRSVDLNWSSTGPAGGSPESGTAAMAPGEGAWIVTLGPFVGPVTVTMSGSATDVRGLSATGPTASATLAPCS